MTHSRISVWLSVAAAAATLFLGAGRAAAQQQEDPSARVARLNFVYGNVSFQPAGETDWVAAVINRPLTSGDSLWVDAGARAEVHVGSTAMRLGQNTGVTLLEVSDRVVQVRVAQGSMILTTRHVDDDDVVEADTPNLAFSLLAPGEYRVDVSADGTETATSVLRGQGQATGGGRTYTVVAGQQARFAGVDELTYEISPLPAPDGLRNWSSDRDRREERADTANYVSREMTGYEDLDDHGEWSYVAAYGPVWRPVGVPLGWAPYRYGHWVWIEPWGWTWVDEQPWGFAPFHYGRWAYAGTGWVWIPGPVVVRPVYAPALVVFVGGGPGAAFAVGGRPGVAWFPLGPGEVFVPAYRVSPVYVTNVNVTNTRVEVTRVTNVYNSYTTNNTREVTQVTYVNQRAPGGVTAVTRETFVGARPVARNVVEVNSAEIARAPVTHVAPVAPVRGSVMGAGAATTSVPPAAVQHRMVVGSRLPAAPPPPFTQREPALNAHPGQPAPRSEAAPPMRVHSPLPAAQPAPRSEPAPAAQPVPHSGPAPTARTQEPPAAQPAPHAQPAPPSRVIEMQGTPPPARPEPAPAPAAQPTHPNVQLAPPVQPKTPQQSREEEQKFQKWQQQQSQQKPAQPAQSSQSKTNKPQEKEKDQPKKPQ
jgi:hypothetical protein